MQIIPYICRPEGLRYVLHNLSKPRFPAGTVSRLRFPAGVVFQQRFLPVPLTVLSAGVISQHSCKLIYFSHPEKVDTGFRFVRQPRISVITYIEYTKFSPFTIPILSPIQFPSASSFSQILLRLPTKSSKPTAEPLSPTQWGC